MVMISRNNDKKAFFLSSAAAAIISCDGLKKSTLGIKKSFPSTTTKKKKFVAFSGFFPTIVRIVWFGDALIKPFLVQVHLSLAHNKFEFYASQ